MNEIIRRRQLSSERLDRLRQQLVEAEKLLNGKACVYVSGSFGRSEASEHSDLDLFIVGKSILVEKGTVAPREHMLPLLGNLDEVLVKADLIKAARELKFPDFDRDGEFIKQHLLDDIVRTIGLPKDDETNTFTARLLLLLESKPLCEPGIYRFAILQVIDSYWKDFSGRENSFIPAFLVNDILRLWRTFCVNYESASSSAQKRSTSKRALKNYKLKHSRILTCFSSIIYCQSMVSLNGTMTPDDALKMVELSPLERLESSASRISDERFSKTVHMCLDSYCDFLNITRDSPETLISRFDDPAERDSLFSNANRFGDLIAEAISLVGGNERLRRIITV